MVENRLLASFRLMFAFLANSFNPDMTSSEGRPYAVPPAPDEASTSNSPPSSTSALFSHSTRPPVYRYDHPRRLSGCRSSSSFSSRPALNTRLASTHTEAKMTTSMYRRSPLIIPAYAIRPPLRSYLSLTLVTSPQNTPPPCECQNASLVMRRFAFRSSGQG